ncbi:KxYKxGKxW signal peptide domain-containing protein [Fructobacillus sp. M158]|uniref:KxYKxGKxW signal peptide domain-containing protein n=1 Tax=Fructobacillus parabroussonetiae TaxID=2713174 RepID=UPI00200A0764|nr:KxYKxGKxW signal peptide domain-containing protein [Fructobacillus parabroussonetiae]MCK8617260.1 KxYKxGKxW signal peptide domain-containing protein [Fructobacillus parabroussonetiae]
MQEFNRVKMYKSGKIWVAAAVAAFAIAGVSEISGANVPMFGQEMTASADSTPITFNVVAENKSNSDVLTPSKTTLEAPATDGNLDDQEALELEAGKVTVDGYTAGKVTVDAANKKVTVEYTKNATPSADTDNKPAEPVTPSTPDANKDADGSTDADKDQNNNAGAPSQEEKNAESHFDFHPAIDDAAANAEQVVAKSDDKAVSAQPETGVEANSNNAMALTGLALAASVLGLSFYKPRH